MSENISQWAQASSASVLPLISLCFILTLYAHANLLLFASRTLLSLSLSVVILTTISLFWQNQEPASSACPVSPPQNMVFFFPHFNHLISSNLKPSHFTPLLFVSSEVNPKRVSHFEADPFSPLLVYLFSAMADSFLDLEVDVNGEEVFLVNKVKILVCLCCLSSLQLFRYLQFLGFFFV